MIYTRSLFLQKPTHVTQVLRKTNESLQIMLAKRSRASILLDE